MSLPVGRADDTVQVVAETPSTFVTAFACQPPLPVWHSVLAESQTSGVGQLGRTWISPPGNLYASVRLPGVEPFSGLAAAPAVGAMLAEALNGLGLSVLVKWPNDLVLAGSAEDSAVLRKVGGILIQERGGVILAGVGLNVGFAPADSQLRAQAALPAGVLPEAALRGAGVHSLVGLWQRLVAVMQACTDGGNADSWRETLLSRLAFRGELVEVLDTQRVCGRLVGVDRLGGLIVRTAEGETTLYSGSLQVRGERLE